MTITGTYHAVLYTDPVCGVCDVPGAPEGQDPESDSAAVMRLRCPDCGRVWSTRWRLDRAPNDGLN